MSSSRMRLLVMGVTDLFLSALEVLGLVKSRNARVMTMIRYFPLVFVLSFSVQLLFDFCDVVVV